MTIQRLYSLPNCRLVLEGLSGNGPTDQTDPRPVLSALMSAECHFQGKGEPLTGGREFFESLVRAVSSYAQEFLSGVPSPLNQNGKAALVHLRKIHGDLHRLTFPENVSSTAPETEAKMPLERTIDLTTVQLFDLVEAVDQFFADPLTLPDLSLNLKPVSKGEVISTEPVAKRVLPAGIGVSGFALAAIAFFFLPIPEVRRPTEPGLETEGSESVESSPTSNPEEPLLEPSPEATNEPSSLEAPPAENLQESLATTPPKITEPEKIEDLQEELYARIDDSWTERISSDLTYRVQVAEDGAIVGYKPINPESEELVDRTPLPKLFYKPADARPTNEPIAEFKVVFRSNGALLISNE